VISQGKVALAASTKYSIHCYRWPTPIEYNDILCISLLSLNVRLSVRHSSQGHNYVMNGISSRLESLHHFRHRTKHRSWHFNHANYTNPFPVYFHFRFLQINAKYKHSPLIVVLHCYRTIVANTCRNTYFSQFNMYYLTRSVFTFIIHRYIISLSSSRMSSAMSVPPVSSSLQVPTPQNVFKSHSTIFCQYRPSSSWMPLKLFSPDAKFFI